MGMIWTTFLTLTAAAGTAMPLQDSVPAPGSRGSPVCAKPAQPAATDNPAQTPAGEAASPTSAPAEIKTADNLLTALETADRGLSTLTARLRYTRIPDLMGDRQVRTGRLYFDNGLSASAESEKPSAAAAEPGQAASPQPEVVHRPRRFAVVFESLKIGDQPADKNPQVLAFDGEWLLEKLPNEKQYNRRRIARAGDGFDPLRIGEGPFPIPVGQKKDDILKRYDAALLPATEGLEGADATETGNLHTFVKDAYQLQLTIKDTLAESSDLQEIRVWYLRSADGALLPRMALTRSADGDQSRIELVDVQVNAPIPPEQLDTTPPGAGWDGRTEDLTQPKNR